MCFMHKIEMRMVQIWKCIWRCKENGKFDAEIFSNYKPFLFFCQKGSVAAYDVDFVLKFALFQNAATAVIHINILSVASKRAL